MAIDRLRPPEAPLSPMTNTSPIDDTTPPDDAAPGVSMTAQAAWVMCAKTVAFAFAIALPVLLVRRLSQYEFGLYRQLFLAVSTGVAVLPLGVGMSAFYFLPRARRRQPHVVLNIVVFYVATAGLAGLLLVARPGLLGAAFNNADLVRYSPLVAVVIGLWAVSSLLETLPLAHQEVKLATAFVVGSVLAKTALLLGATLWFATLHSLLYAAAIQGALQTAVLLLYLRSRFPGFWSAWDWSLMRRQFSYALPFGFAGLLFSLQLDLHSYFVANQFGAEAYALYAVGCFQLPLVALLNDSVSSVLIPRVSRLQKSGGRREIVLLTARAMRKLAAIYFPLYAFLIVAGREFIAVLFTDQYLASWSVFAVNLTLLPLNVLMVDPILRAHADQRYFLIRLRVALVAVLAAGLWAGREQLGLPGVIAIVVAVNLVGRLITAVRASQVLGATCRDLALLKDVGRLAAAAIAAGVVTALLRVSLAGLGALAVLVACGLAFSLVFVAATFLLGVLTLEEKEAIRGQLLRLRYPPTRRGVPDLMTPPASNG
jgi:O-antigen/teichoic acid export membrane protein